MSPETGNTELRVTVHMLKEPQTTGKADRDTGDG